MVGPTDMISCFFVIEKPIMILLFFWQTLIIFLREKFCLYIYSYQRVNPSCKSSMTLCYSVSFDEYGNMVRGFLLNRLIKLTVTISNNYFSTI